MTSTYTTNQGLEKPAAGDQSGTWGGTVNTNMDIIDRAICGVASLTLTGSTTTLTTTDGTLTDGMYRVLILGDGGDLGSDNTITISPNDQSKCYLVYNNLTANRNAIFTQGSGGNITVSNGATAWIYADGAGAGAEVRQGMVSTEIADQDGDTKIQVEEGGDDDDTIRFDTGGAERMTVASGGTVDVVGDLTVGTVTADGDTSAGDAATVGYTATEGLILTGQGSTDDITIKNDADTTVVNVATGDTDVEISAGSLLFGTASTGVYLGVTSATAANLLDDYEEGTWTPALWTDSVQPTVSSGSLSGRYTKIGRTVVITMTSGFTLSGTGTGNFGISGLPFTSAATHTATGTLTGRGLNEAGTTVIVNPYIPNTNDKIYFNVYDQDAYPAGQTLVQANSLSTSVNGANMNVSIVYTA